jgi:hypothetical protein
MAYRRLCGAESRETIMTIRTISALLCGAAFLLVAAAAVPAAFGDKLQGLSSSAHAANVKKGSKQTRRSRWVTSLDVRKATTVKSSKSNSSDRMGGGGGKGSAAKTTTVKSSKSNTSDRMGGGGKGAVQLNPQPEPPGVKKR